MLSSNIGYRNWGSLTVDNAIDAIVTGSKQSIEELQLHGTDDPTIIITYKYLMGFPIRYLYIFTTYYVNKKIYDKI
jgi:hypothetical protein